MVVREKESIGRRKRRWGDEVGERKEEKGERARWGEGMGAGTFL